MSGAVSLSPIDVPAVYPLAQERVIELPLGYPPRPVVKMPRIGVILHAFHLSLMPELLAYLACIPYPADVLISTDTDEKRQRLEALFAAWDKGIVRVTVTPNRGRDIAPKMVGHGAAQADYDLVLHLHTKQSNHEAGLAGWRGYLLETLLGSEATVRGVVELFRQAPTLGLVAPQQIEILRPWIGWGANYDQAAALAGRMGFAINRSAPLDFPAGSMFWARPAALRPLLEAGLSFEDFQAEEGQTDGTLAHAIERLYFLVCEAAGFDWVKVAAAGLLHEDRGVQSAGSPDELRRILGRSRIRLSTAAAGGEVPPGRAPISFFPPRPKRPAFRPWRVIASETRGQAAGRISVVACHAGADKNPATAFMEALVEGADLILILSQPGLLHPDAASTLLHMVRTQASRILLEPAIVPGTGAQRASSETFALMQTSGQALAVSNEAATELGAPGWLADGGATLDAYVARARNSGIPLLLCPAALFFPQAGASA